MNKEDLVRQVAAKAAITKKDAEKAVSAITEVIMDSLADGESIKLVGFGSFECRERKSRTGRNPQTGEEMIIPATTVPYFSPGKFLKEKVSQMA